MMHLFIYRYPISVLPVLQTARRAPRYACSLRRNAALSPPASRTTGRPSPGAPVSSPRRPAAPRGGPLAPPGGFRETARHAAAWAQEGGRWCVRRTTESDCRARGRNVLDNLLLAMGPDGPGPPHQKLSPPGGYEGIIREICMPPH